MKKQFGFPLMLASALAFSACSSDDVADKGNGSLTDFSNGGYVKLAINLPTVKDAGAFKASESDYNNDNFDDGLEAEYDVKNASVILFQGNNENDAQFHSAYTLPTDDVTDPTTTTKQITKVLQLTKPVKGNKIGNNLYALVILNNNGLITVNDDHTLTIGTTSSFIGTFQEFKQKTATSSTYDVNQFVSPTGGFFMSNAPLANKAGGATDPTTAGINTLVKLNGSTYKTSDEAEATPAADIYVERGVAKVTFTNDKTTATDFMDANNFKTPLSNGAGIADVKYTITGWGLDITNKSSYLVRHYSSAWNGLKTDDASVTNKHRFIGSKVVEVGKTPLQYRTYWAEDPNYTSYDANLNNEFSIQPDGEPTHISNKFGTTAVGDAQYCFENTFDVANQNQDRTTRVIVRAQVTVNGTAADFYMINNGKSTLYSEANLKALVQNAIYNDPQVQKLLTTTAGATLNEGDINVTFTDNTTTAVRTITGFSFTINGTPYSKTSTALNNVLENANAKVSNIIKYTNGIVYYPVRIKHFGNDLTPWDKNQTGVSSTNIYAGNNADKYLGRYGVVRNNWYDLGVNRISGIGSAVVPPHKEDTPDDELDQYISVRINVLSWAKRTQREDL